MIEKERLRLSELERFDILDTPPDGAFDDITALAAKFFNVPIAVVSLVDVDRVWFKSAHGLPGLRQTDRGPGLCVSAILQDGAYVAPDLRRDPNSLANPLVAAANGFRFYAAVPLRSRNFSLGTMCLLDYVPRDFTEADEHMLLHFSRLVMHQMEIRISSREIATIASHIADNNSELTQLVRADPLTGLLNRGAIQAELERSVASSAHRQPCAVLMFDLDHFKLINDTFGHPGGDSVLIEVARRLRNAVRASDMVGRYGGEEFLVLLNACSHKSALRIAEKIRNAVCGRMFKIDQNEVAVTISGGLTFVTPNHTPLELLRIADQALYLAKERGRNQVIVTETILGAA